MDEVKKVIDDLGAAFEQFKEANEREIGEIKKGSADYVTTEKLERINKALDELVDAKSAAEARIDEIEKKGNRPELGADGEKGALELKAFNDAVAANAAENGKRHPGEVDAKAYDSYRDNFRTFLKSGDLEVERKDMQVGSDPDGGYLVPADMSGRIITRIFETSPIRQIASVLTIGSDRLEGMNDLDEADAGWVGETGTRSDTDTPQVGKYEIPVHEMYAMPRATQKLLDDAAIDVEAWLAGKVADKLARTENAAFVTGNGVSKPHGFTAYTTAATADGSRTWGTLEHILSGASADFAASDPADKLFDVEAAMKPALLAGARWVTRRSVIAKVRKFKSTDDQYLWQPGLQAGAPASLIGYPITLAEDMPALAADSLSMALGNFAEGYQIVDRLGVRVLRDPFTAKPYVRFYTTKRTGGAVVNFDAIKFLKFNS
jgi:HK97 family phage major capsid protein